LINAIAMIREYDWNFFKNKDLETETKILTTKF